MSESEHEPTVYIVDDEPDVRDALRWVLKTVGLRVETFDSAASFLCKFVPGGSGCLVLDVRMPGMSGLELFEELIARGESMPAIFITGFADVPMAIRAMKSGAVEFVEKPFNGQALIEKVQRALKDDAHRRRLRADRAEVDAKFRRLTEKEREVLDLIKDGRQNKEIATSFGITPRAVEMRRASLMKKLGVRSMAELLRLSIAYDIDADRGRASR